MFTPLKNLPEGKNWTLDELNDKEVHLLIPVIIYISITMVAGTVGNALVLYVNIIAIKLQNSTHRYCITFLAMVDMSFCMIAKPFLLGVLTHPYTFTSILTCKILRTFKHFIGNISILVLFTIAVDRSRRICRPHGKQLSVRLMKRIFGIFLVISLISAFPFFILYGKNTVQTGIANITGIQCFPDDNYKDTLFPNGYMVFLCVTFIILSASMSYFYILMWREIWNLENKKKTNAVSYVTKTNVCSDQTDMSTIEMPSERNITQTHYNIRGDSICADEPGKYASDGNRKRVKTKSTCTAKTIRASKILFVVTAFFVLSFMPHLFLEILTYFDEELINNLDNASTVIYQLFWKSFAINFMINPLIYSVMDTKFRKECKKICCKRFHN